MTITVVNTHPTPFVYDDEGHVLGAYWHGEVDENHERVAPALESGRLLPLDPKDERLSKPTPDVGPPGVTAETDVSYDMVPVKAPVEAAKEGE